MSCWGKLEIEGLANPLPQIDHIISSLLRRMTGAFLVWRSPTQSMWLARAYTISAA